MSPHPKRDHELSYMIGIFISLQSYSSHASTYRIVIYIL